MMVTVQPAGGYSMRNQYGVTIAIVAIVLGATAPAFADTVRDDGSLIKNSAKWQNDAVKRMPPDVVIDNTNSTKQTVLEKLPLQQNIWSGNSFRAGVRK
jgi:hypothetical protein